MSWKIALIIALLTGVFSAWITAYVADFVTKAHGVSDLEGARGMAIAFLFIPAGFIGGALLGLLATKLVHATEWAHFWKAAGISVLLGQAVLWGIAGLSLLTIPKPPTVDGIPLVLETEVLVPQERMTAGARSADGMRVSLYAGGKDNQYATVDTAAYRLENGRWVVPARCELRSRSFTRVLSFYMEDHTWLAFDLPLVARPTAADSNWTEPKPMRDARRSGSDAQLSDVLLRYRVVACSLNDVH